MIESIRVAKVATYGEAQGDLVGLSTFNYIYGPNAAGKTTLSNLIGNPSEPSFSSCQINWKAGAPLQTLVYNRNFIERNFNPSSQLKGIFTLGEENIETLEAIKKAKEKRDELDGKVVALTVTLNGPDGNGGKEEDLRKVRDRLKEQCWSQKKKHDAQFQLAFSTYGVRADSEKFLGQFLIENNSNTATLEKFETLAEKAKTVFGKTPLAEPLLPILNSASSLLAHESNAILTKHVVGRDDVDIAAMIKKLGNSDWVKEGWGYFKVNDEHCPFCQQVTPQTLHQSLSEYFDETFVADTKAIIDMQSSFEADSNSIHSVLTGLLTSPSAFLDDEKLAELHKLFDAKRTVNLQKIAGKVKEPSSVIQLDSLDDVLKGAAAVIEDANLRIAKHNEMVLDITKERQTLVSQIWKYLLEVELKQELADYTKDSSSLLLAITALKEKIKIMSQERVAADLEIQGLEKKTTSTQPAVDAINKTLKSFNFRSFQIAQAESNTYRLVRADGSEAKETLSEGERTFVTFLYFGLLPVP
jgi:wobble nucleotide-excising tRNase